MSIGGDAITVAKGRVLVVAGSDSGGGAGIQADIKAISALGGYAMTAVTALTAQNTLGVHGIHPVPPAFVARQMEVVLDDIGADAVKIGMLGDAVVIETVAEVLKRRAQGVPVVLDPVMVAKGGHPLLPEDAVEALARLLLPLAALVTPNAPEAEALTGRRLSKVSDMEEVGRALLDLGPGAVLMKGGHLPGETVTDLLVSGEGTRRFEAPRIRTTSTHGTGCTLASAIAAGLAVGMSLEAASARAHAYVQRAISSAPGLGVGHGPLNHLHTVRPFP